MFLGASPEKGNHIMSNFSVNRKPIIYLDLYPIHLFAITLFPLDYCKIVTKPALVLSYERFCFWDRSMDEQKDEEVVRDVFGDSDEDEQAEYGGQDEIEHDSHVRLQKLISFYCF